MENSKSATEATRLQGAVDRDAQRILGYDPYACTRQYPGVRDVQYSAGVTGTPWPQQAAQGALPPVQAVKHTHLKALTDATLAAEGNQAVDRLFAVSAEMARRKQEAAKAEAQLKVQLAALQAERNKQAEVKRVAVLTRGFKGGDIVTARQGDRSYLGVVVTGEAAKQHLALCGFGADAVMTIGLGNGYPRSFERGEVVVVHGVCDYDVVTCVKAAK